jgi:hypothetical protein
MAAIANYAKSSSTYFLARIYPASNQPIFYVNIKIGAKNFIFGIKNTINTSSDKT